MKLTDVARSVDKVQYSLNRIGFSKAHAGRHSSRITKDVVKETTIFEENEVKFYFILSLFLEFSMK